MAVVLDACLHPGAHGHSSRPESQGVLVPLTSNGFCGAGPALALNGLRSPDHDKIARAWPGAQAAFDLHESVSLLGLGFAAFHALVLLGDRYIGYELAQILIPFTAGTYRPFWVGVGQIGLYVWAIISLSYYVKKQIGQPSWKLIHFAAFFNFVVAILHGLTSGTDTGTTWAQVVYWICYRN